MSQKLASALPAHRHPYQFQDTLHSSFDMQFTPSLAAINRDGRNLRRDSWDDKRVEEICKEARETLPGNEWACCLCSYLEKKKFSNYKQHLRTHIPKLKIQEVCPYCVTTFTSAGGLSRHIQQQHPRMRTSGSTSNLNASYPPTSPIQPKKLDSNTRYSPYQSPDMRRPWSPTAPSLTPSTSPIYSPSQIQSAEESFLNPHLFPPQHHSPSFIGAPSTYTPHNFPYQEGFQHDYSNGAPLLSGSVGFDIYALGRSPLSFGEAYINQGARAGGSTHQNNPEPLYMQFFVPDDSIKWNIPPC